MSYGRERIVIPVRIQNGQSLSDEINVDALRIVGVIMPAVWTTANLTFASLLSEPAALPKVPVYGAVLDGSGNELAVTSPAQATYVSLADALPFRALGRLKVRSGTVAIPVAQAAERNFSLICVAS